MFDRKRINKKKYFQGLYRLNSTKLVPKREIVFIQKIYMSQVGFYQRYVCN